MSETATTQESMTPQAKRLVDAIDQKFTEAEEQVGEIPEHVFTREHEQVIRLESSEAFPGASPDARIFATRPIPEEAEEAAERWSNFGGYHIQVHEHQGRVQTDYIVRDGKIAHRRIVDNSALSIELPAPSPLNIGEKGHSFGGIHGEPMNDPAAEEEIGEWVEGAVPQIEKTDEQPAQAA